MITDSGPWIGLPLPQSIHPPFDHFFSFSLLMNPSLKAEALERFVQCLVPRRTSLNNRLCPRKALSCYCFFSATLLHPLFSSMSDQKCSTGVWDTGPHTGSTSKDDMADINRTLGPMIGIDLGTSNSCVSLWHTVKNRAKVIKNVSIQSKCSSHLTTRMWISARMSN